jgi:uncharacterized membrane protein HdeD (DUF308 family)
VVAVAVATAAVVGSALLIGGVIRFAEWMRDRWDEAAAAVGL